ncbi:histidine triad nucleotide-binding protein [Candidatus Desantisbacteria bacterium CG07_land_8_20_14_0_80_39_15]|uniref:Histidine triad nucleotide-binding protein n=2 Tax=unclassified Candidatus Desantisiibacteriota TaxID=3106372 RepID=A0A2H9PBX3_9BACT|nr:MAG: histidine triad nucleotide-binding protein [Candidatus Desantisbacteria bacterium CG07_land_8_20_14_0_80_39_15]PIZ15378.1 MAG: histidine triad nucleotide-binding protein [Candidatus Desantisbacteria bacterium CG_4_10_14_0_8_um_filter_39_17]
MGDCLFCKIANKEVESSIVYEDETLLAFNDINPQAPVHILIVPKKHIPTLLGVKDEDKDLIFSIHRVITNLAQEKNLVDGFRVVINCGPNAGQAVYHLHFHLLGGRKMEWPPG